MVTLQTLRDTFYGILREDQSDSSSYPLVLADLLLNSAQQAICFWNIVNPIPIRADLTGAKKWQLPFLHTDKYYSNIAPVSLSATTTVGANTLNVSDTSNYPSSWLIYIAGNIITYTGKTSTSFTWCTNVLFAHKSWSQVSVVYQLPTDYASVINVVYNDKFKLEAKLYDDVFESMNDIKWSSYWMEYNSNYPTTKIVPPFYTVKDNQYLIIWNLNSTWMMIRLRYEKKPTTMVNSTDIVTIDNDIYANTTIAFYAVWEMLYNRGEEKRASELLNFALAKVNEMYTYYNNTSFEEISGVKIRSGKWRINL